MQEYYNPKFRIGVVFKTLPKWPYLGAGDGLYIYMVSKARKYGCECGWSVDTRQFLKKYDANVVGYVY